MDEVHEMADKKENQKGLLLLTMCYYNCIMLVAHIHW